ncbi:C40 family peptidase [Actinomadura flavalba]|uniref:C40 family peptidase n=1 Tax=Actinomadura flavalba TaxID=1120938 RepID=UPI00035C21A3|nr:C40 family peptidase [Actinomadura flavalba]
MSIPLKAACGAATVTLAIASGAATAQAAPERPERPVAAHAVKQKTPRPAAQSKTAKTKSTSARNAQRLAALQQAVRKKRKAMTAKWDRRAQRAVTFALAQRGKPYRWGGTGSGGFDCSGLVQQAWKRAGVGIPRVTNDQYAKIRDRVAKKNLRAGDLVFFNRLGHVGLYLGDNTFIHSPRPGRTVTKEKMTGYYTRNYVGAVRPAWTKLPAVPTSLDG